MREVWFFTFIVSWDDELPLFWELSCLPISYLPVYQFKRLSPLQAYLTLVFSQGQPFNSGHLTPSRLQRHYHLAKFNASAIDSNDFIMISYYLHETAIREPCSRPNVASREDAIHVRVRRELTRSKQLAAWRASGSLKILLYAVFSLHVQHRSAAFLFLYNAEYVSFTILLCAVYTEAICRLTNGELKRDNLYWCWL